MTKQEALNKIAELKQYVEGLDKPNATLAMQKCGEMGIYDNYMSVNENIISISLPNANTDWSIAVFKWCVRFIEQNPHSTVSHREERKITIEFRAN